MYFSFVIAILFLSLPYHLIFSTLEGVAESIGVPLVYSWLLCGIQSSLDGLPMWIRCLGLFMLLMVFRRQSRVLGNPDKWLTFHREGFYGRIDVVCEIPHREVRDGDSVCLLLPEYVAQKRRADPIGIITLPF